MGKWGGVVKRFGCSLCFSLICDLSRNSVTDPLHELKKFAILLGQFNSGEWSIILLV